MFGFLRHLFGKNSCTASRLSDIDNARRLIAAIDAGGIPLDPGIIRRVAESFGLEVSRTARTEEIIERIRAALSRCDDQA